MDGLFGSSVSVSEEPVVTVPAVYTPDVVMEPPAVVPITTPLCAVVPEVVPMPKRTAPTPPLLMTYSSVEPETMRYAQSR